MKFYLISDNTDTLVGLRLAGIEGVVVHTAEETLAALDKAAQNPQVAIVLMTEKLVKQCQHQVDQFKLTHAIPLVVIIPDRHGNGRAKDSITRYVREAIGIKV